MYAKITDNGNFIVRSDEIKDVKHPNACYRNIRIRTIHLIDKDKESVLLTNEGGQYYLYEHYRAIEKGDYITFEVSQLNIMLINSIISNNNHKKRIAKIERSITFIKIIMIVAILMNALSRM